MNIRQIEVFKAIMTTGSISDAARLLHISAPSVSRILAHTEINLKFPLFERVKGRLHPTVEAFRIHGEVLSLYVGIQRITDLTHELSARRESLVTVVSSPSIGQMLIPMAIGQFKSGSPDVRVHFSSLSHELLKENLLSNRSEIGVSILPVEHPNLLTEPIARSRLVCIFPHAHALANESKVTVKQLAEHPLITYPSGTPFACRVAELFRHHNSIFSSSIEVGSPHNACALVHVGAGVAIVDEFSLEAWQNSRFKTLQIVNAEHIYAHLVHLRSGQLSPAAESFVRALRSVLIQRGLHMGRASST